MIDLEKERELFEKFFQGYSFILDFCNEKNQYKADITHAVFTAWITRAELAQAEKAKLQAQIAELQQKLARYENPDYVLVPRKPTEKMCEALSQHVCCYDGTAWLDSDEAYEAMIEAVENDDE